MAALKSAAAALSIETGGILLGWREPGAIVVVELLEVTDPTAGHTAYTRVHTRAEAELQRGPAVLDPTLHQPADRHTRRWQSALRLHLNDQAGQLDVGCPRAGFVLGSRTVRFTCRRVPVAASVGPSTVSRQAPARKRLWPGTSQHRSGLSRRSVGFPLASLR